jgi:hypothetical protein
MADADPVVSSVSASVADVGAEGCALLEPLRAGQSDETLFLLPGLEGDITELVPLIGRVQRSAGRGWRRSAAGGQQRPRFGPRGSGVGGCDVVGGSVATTPRSLPNRRLLVRCTAGPRDGTATAVGRRNRRCAVPHRGDLRRAVLAESDLAARDRPPNRTTVGRHRPHASREGGRRTPPSQHPAHTALRPSTAGYCCGSAQVRRDPSRDPRVHRDKQAPSAVLPGLDDPDRIDL